MALLDIPHARSLCVYREPIARGVGQGLFAESAMIMCTGFNCIPCMQKTALSSVLATSAQKRPFYELSPDTVQDVFYVLSLGPHFCHPIPSFDKSTGDGRGLITLQGC